MSQQNAGKEIQAKAEKRTKNVCKNKIKNQEWLQALTVS